MTQSKAQFKLEQGPHALPKSGRKNSMSELLKRITVHDRICNGEPVIRGMRITAQTISNS